MGLQTAEKAQLTDKTKADTIRQLLAVVDSFEMAKGQLKPESEGEKKIDGSYQVIAHAKGKHCWASRMCFCRVSCTAASA